MDTSTDSKAATIPATAAPLKESEAPAQRSKGDDGAAADENSNSTDSEGQQKALAKSAKPSPPAAALKSTATEKMLTDDDSTQSDDGKKSAAATSECEAKELKESTAKKANVGTKKAQKSASNSPTATAMETDATANADSRSSAQKSPAATSPQIPPTIASQTPTTADIPDTILSPPKSETQTDETNTATSSSPASDAQLSPAGTNTAPATPTEEVPGKRGEMIVPSTTTTTPAATATSGGTRVVQPINVVANGTIPKSGKPLMSAMNKKLTKTPRPTRPRKQKALVAMYESEISDNKVGIKLCIKKSDSGAGPITPTATSSGATTASNTPAATATTTTAATTPSKQNNRKRSRKSKARPRVDSDDSEYETKRKKERAPNNNTDRQKKVSFSGVAADAVREPIEQTEWGAKMPEDVLYKIFQIVVEREGCLPTLLRLGRVCSLWRRASLMPTLWRNLDLSTWIKEKYRTEWRLKWFVDNRCSACTDLNVSNWKVSDINCFLGKLAVGCPNLMGITLSGWKGFTSDHLTFLVENMKKLARVDLSSVNVEMNASKSAVGLQSLCNAVQTINGRLTHLYLAHNRLAGIPQVVTILSTHCPNLVLLDLSNVTTQATSHGILHIEKLQHGCRKLKVLRVTNSHVTLSTATMQEMMDSPGFPDLEELSIAALTDESRVIGDEHLQRILKSSSKLKLLDVRGCSRLTHESLIRLPAWDIKHLFLSGCSVTRDMGSGLELIASKWAHSLIELDLAWANVQQPLDNALRALAEKGSESPLAHLNLCGSSVSDDAVKDILANCAHMSSINLSSCRGLPRGVKRLMQGAQELHELREVLKVQMKVKLPSQLKQEQEEREAAERKVEASATDGGDSGGGGDGGEGGGGKSQTN